MKILKSDFARKERAKELFNSRRNIYAEYNLCVKNAENERLSILLLSERINSGQLGKLELDAAKKLHQLFIKSLNGFEKKANRLRNSYPYLSNTLG